MASNRWLALLIVVATALFAIGVSVEKSDSHTESSEPAHVEGVSEEGEETEASQVSDEEGEESETLLGVDLESTPLVVVAVIASLGLALGAWIRPDSQSLLALIVIAMLAFAVLDIREVVHQLDEDEAGLALLAGLVAALHLAAAAVAAQLHRSRGSDVNVA